MAGQENDGISKANEEIKHGEKERKNVRTRTASGYLIEYEDGEFHVTDKEVDYAFKLYCIGQLTINQVAWKMEWTRAKMWALKTAFGITKTDPIPFTPEKIDSMTVDEIAEEIRITKKQFALAKFESEKFKDIEKEVKHMNRTKFWFDEVLKQLTPLDIKPINQKIELPKWNDGVQYAINITDVHSGLEVDSIYNHYNVDIMDESFDYIALWIAENCSNNKPILLFDKGDIIHGLIHGSVEKYSSFVVPAMGRVIKAYARLIKFLLDMDYKVIFGKVNGSHSSVEKVKDKRTDEENFGNLVNIALEVAFNEHPNFTILEKVKGETHVVADTVFGYSLLLAHGDECSQAKLAEKAIELSRLLNKEIIEVLAGHIHHYKAEKFNTVLVEYSEPVCGTDQYSGGKGYNAPKGFRVNTYGEYGRVGTHFVDLRRMMDV